MNLKEGFHYQNFLNNLMTEADEYLYDEEHLFTITRKHKRKAANPDAEDLDEKVEVNNPFDANDMIQFMLSLITEKEELTAAINSAKADANRDIDALTEGNKLRNTLCKRAMAILKKKGGTTTRAQRGYMLNNEKNQVAYYYDVEETKEEIFVRSSLSEILEEASKETTEVSNQIDVLRVTTDLDFTPRFNVNLTFDEVVKKYIEELKKQR